MSPSLTFRTGVRDVLPTVFGYIGVGLAFGIVAHTSHLSLLVVAGLSFVVYAGSAQFIITSMLLLHDPLSAIFISTFLVNSRMILMSTSLAQYFKHESLTRNLLIGTLVTDETFALAMNKQNKTNGKLSFAWQSAANLVAYLVWGRGDRRWRHPWRPNCGPLPFWLRLRPDRDVHWPGLPPIN